MCFREWPARRHNKTKRSAGIASCSTKYRPHLEPLERRYLLSNLPMIVVHPGQSIQATVDMAPAGGAVINIEPGTYSQTVSISKRAIQLIGLEDRTGHGVTIENPGGQGTGISVTAAGTGFVLRHLTVQDFSENGVRLSGVNGFVLSHVSALNDGDYGVFPEFSWAGIIEGSTATGNRDTGIYVGQSHDVTIFHNVVSGNVNGIEIENSSRVLALANQCFDNVAGILVDLLPGLSVTSASDNVVAGNNVHDNNHVNFAPPGDLASFEPTGTGILILGADRTTVFGNVVTGNQFTGIALASTTFLASLAGIPVTGIEPNPDSTEVRSNIVLGNGTTSPFPTIPGADLLWDGTGNHNCWTANLFVTSFWPGSPLPLPSC
jgi:parallel beta-helix repeat protein